MTLWKEFAEAAPHIATVFTRRHAATRKLCLLATIRSDGSPRISPIEPRFFEGRLWLIGMPNTTKFHDLSRDPRFCLHTATIDTEVKDGDAKLWGAVENVQDKALHERFAVDLFNDIGLDLRGQEFEHFYAANITSASSVEVDNDQLKITIWKPGQPERTVMKRG